MGFVCSKCGSSDSTSYDIDFTTGKATCGNCKQQKHVVQHKPHLPIFSRWSCKTHNCGSYSRNSLIRHEMPNCIIEDEETVGVIKPKTFGGLNGNVGREYFSDWLKQHQQKDLRQHAITMWQKYSKREQTRRDRRKRNAYSIRNV